MKHSKLVQLLIVIFVFMFFQYISFLTVTFGNNNFRLPFPGLQKTSSQNCDEVRTLPLVVNRLSSNDNLANGCWCTLVGYSTLGFPFRVNLYDACGQDPAIIWWIQYINWIIQFIVLVPIYMLSKKLVKRNHAKSSKN
jgi:hypothetical protein